MVLALSLTCSGQPALLVLGFVQQAAPSFGKSFIHIVLKITRVNVTSLWLEEPVEHYFNPFNVHFHTTVLGKPVSQESAVQSFHIFRFWLLILFLKKKKIAYKSVLRRSSCSFLPTDARWRMSDGSLRGPFGRGMLLGWTTVQHLTAAVALQLWFGPVGDGCTRVGSRLGVILEVTDPCWSRTLTDSELNLPSPGLNDSCRRKA